MRIGGKLAGIAFYGKMRWGYDPLGGELGRRLLEGWSRVRGRVPQHRRWISIAVFEVVVR